MTSSYLINLKSCINYVLKFFFLFFVLIVICGEFSETYKSTQSNDYHKRRVRRQLFGALQNTTGLFSGIQRCINHDGTSGICQTGYCANLNGAKGIQCNSFWNNSTFCCPTKNNAASVLPVINHRFVCGIRPNDENMRTVGGGEVALLPALPARPVTDNTRIVGGVEAVPHSWPWAVGIYQITYNSNIEVKNKFICGGTLISENYVLTAAHCILRKAETLGPRNFRVQVGAHDIKNSGFFVNTSELRVHESYTFSNHKNDIAIIKLAEPINFNTHENVLPVCLPTPDMERYTLAGNMSYLIGWGTTSEGGKPSQVLQEVRVPIVNTEVCASRYKSLLGVNDQIYEKHLCAGYLKGGKDTCQGDSGGSLTVPINKVYYQMGIVSFGKGCAQAGYPGVYTRVTTFLDWIADHTRD